MTTAILLALLLIQPRASQRDWSVWLPNPREANGTWVADPSRHLRPATVDSINALVTALSRETGGEIAVVVVDSTAGLEPGDFARSVHRRWGVGQRGRDNGLVLLWVPAQRAVEITVGTGLEGVIPDSRAGRIIDRSIIPAFRRDDFDAGMLAGVAALAAAVREEPNPQGLRQPARGAEAPAGASTLRSPDEEPDGGGVPAWAIALLGAGGVGAAAAGVLLYRRRRPRKCPHGHGPMRRLDEDADDEFLDRGERSEERLGSVNYDVWRCDVCGERTVVARPRWFTSLGTCPECRRRTVRTTSRTLRAATTTHSGAEQVTESCGNCGWMRQYERVLPQIVVPPPSSGGSSGRSGGGFSGGGSSRGGGSSFGGGGTSGGGAGRRY